MSEFLRTTMWRRDESLVKDGKPGLFTFHPSQKARVLLSVEQPSSSCFSMNDQNGRSRHSLFLNPDDTPSLRMSDGRGNTKVQIPGMYGSQARN